MIEWDDDIEYESSPADCPECEGGGCSFGFSPDTCPALGRAVVTGDDIEYAEGED